MGLGILIAELLDDRHAFDAFWRVALATLVVIVIGGVAKNVWKGKDVAEAGAGPLTIKFADLEKNTRDALTTVNARVDDQMKDINERLRANEHRLARLEDQHFKDEA